MEIGTKKMAAGDATGSPESAIAREKFRKPLVNYLISGLEEKDAGVRIMAAEMLRDIADARMIEYLQPLLVDQPPDLRAVSEKVLDRICDNMTAGAGSSPDSCGNCMNRFIAEEALMKLRSRTGGAHDTYGTEH
jgi:HEAT repeat protein